MKSLLKKYGKKAINTLTPPVIKDIAGDLKTYVVKATKPKAGFRAASFTPTSKRTPIVYGKTSEKKKSTNRRGKMRSPRGR